MLRCQHPAAAHRVGMDVIDLLEHRRVRIDGLRVETFLPRLGDTVVFVGGAIGDESIHQPAAPFGLDLRQELAGGELLEIAHGAGKLVGVQHGVEMILHDHPGVDAHAFVSAAIFE